MPYQYFLIAPGLNLINNASLYNLKILYKGCIMKLRKDAIDLTNKKFGDLTALCPIKKGKYRGILWKCVCDCGNESIAYGGHLRAGKRVSCGCKSESRIFETGINRLFAGYKRMAKRRNHEFSIPRESFATLILGDCFYCGIKPSQVLKRLKSRKLQIEYNGIDRFDPKKGYIEGNCVSCCYYCNHGKSDLTYEEFKNHVTRIFKWNTNTF